MSKNLYIATMEPGAGKSVVALGIMELLSRRVNMIGFFRPIIPDVERDNNIQLIANNLKKKPLPKSRYMFFPKNRCSANQLSVMSLQI